MADEYIEVTLDGEKLAIDPMDIDGCEWRLAKKVTGLPAGKIMQAATDMDFEAVAALVWLTKRRDDRECEYEAVLSGLTLASFQDDDEDEEEEGDGEGPSTVSLHSDDADSSAA